MKSMMAELLKEGGHSAVSMLPLERTVSENIFRRLALLTSMLFSSPPCRDFDSLDERNVEKNNQLAFDIAEKEFGISPIMTGKDMASVGEPDKLSMVMYLTQFYEMFKDSIPSSGKGLRTSVLDLVMVAVFMFFCASCPYHDVHFQCACAFN